MFQPGGDGFTLLVGEGNFSFAAAISKQNASGCRCYATSFETANGCYNKYGKEEVSKNVQFLHSVGANVIFGVNAKKLEETLCSHINVKAFDLIIFQFPHTGRKASISNNRRLLKDFFDSASSCLKTDTGRIVVTLCAGQGGTPADSVQREHCNSWQVVEMAAYSNLILTKVSPFSHMQFEGYLPTGRRNAGNAFITNQAMCHKFAPSAPAPTLLPVTEVIRPHQGWNSAPINKCMREGAVASSYIKERIDLVTMELDTLPQNLLEKELLQGLSFSNELNSRLQKLVDSSALGETKHNCSTVGDNILYIGYKFSPRPSLLVHVPAALALLESRLESSCCCHGIVFQSIPKECIGFASPCCYQLMIIRTGTAELDLLERIKNTVKGFSSSSTTIPLKLVDSIAPEFQDMCNTAGLTVNVEKASAVCMVSESKETRIGWESRVSQLPENRNNLVSNTIITLFDLDALLMVVNPGILKNSHHMWSLSRDTRVRLLGCLGSRTEYLPRSLHPPSYSHDFSFWVPTKSCGAEEAFDEADLVDIVLSSVDDTAVSLELLETYVEGDKTSLCYRIVYKSYDFPLSKDCSNKLQATLRENLIKYLSIDLR